VGIAEPVGDLQARVQLLPYLVDILARRTLVRLAVFAPGSYAALLPACSSISCSGFTEHFRTPYGIVAGASVFAACLAFLVLVLYVTLAVFAGRFTTIVLVLSRGALGFDAQRATVAGLAIAYVCSTQRGGDLSSRIAAAVLS
jgi:hypothetical protein